MYFLQVWSFKALQERCNAVAHWALAQGWAEGDVVALYMESHPLVVALWLGLAMVGVEAAFINHNLRQESLLHCVGVSGARAVVFGAEMTEGGRQSDTHPTQRCSYFELKGHTPGGGNTSNTLLLWLNGNIKSNQGIRK